MKNQANSKNDPNKKYLRPNLSKISEPKHNSLSAKNIKKNLYKITEGFISKKDTEEIVRNNASRLREINNLSDSLYCHYDNTALYTKTTQKIEQFNYLLHRNKAVGEGASKNFPGEYSGSFSTPNDFLNTYDESLDKFDEYDNPYTSVLRVAIQASNLSKDANLSIRLALSDILKRPLMESPRRSKPTFYKIILDIYLDILGTIMENEEIDYREKCDSLRDLLDEIKTLHEDIVNKKLGAHLFKTDSKNITGIKPEPLKHTSNTLSSSRMEDFMIATLQEPSVSIIPIQTNNNKNLEYSVDGMGTIPSSSKRDTMSMNAEDVSKYLSSSKIKNLEKGASDSEKFLK